MNHADSEKGQLPIESYSVLFESNNIYLNLFQTEFESFKTFKHQKRSQLIKQNKELRNMISTQIKNSKNSTKLNFETKKINEIQAAYTEINKTRNFDLNPVSKHTNPILTSEIIDITNTYLNDWFDEIPHNLDDYEKIFNPEFAIWILIKGLQVLKSQVQHFDQLFFVEVLSIFSNIIDKNSSTVFKFLQIYLKRIINNIHKQKAIESSSCSVVKKHYVDFNLDDLIEFDLQQEEDINEFHKCVNNDSRKNIRLDLKENLTKVIDCNNKKNVEATDNLIDLLLKYISVRKNCVSPIIRYKKFHKNMRDEDAKLAFINNESDKIMNIDDEDGDDDKENIKVVYNTNTINNKTKNNYKMKNKTHNDFFEHYKNKNNNIDKNRKKNKDEFLFKKKVNKEGKDTPKRRMDFFRGAYCQICFTYYCPYHFKRDYKFYDYEFNNITLHKRYLKRLITETKQRSGLEIIDFLNIFNEKENTEQKEKQEKAEKEENEENEEKPQSSSSCKLNISFNLNLNEVNEDEFYNINGKININKITNNDNENDHKNKANESQSPPSRCSSLSYKNLTNLPQNNLTSKKSLSKAPMTSASKKKNYFTSERERRTTKTHNNYCDSESPKKPNSSLYNLSRAKQVIHAYKLNVNDYNPCKDHEGTCTQESCDCLKNRSSCEKFCFCRGRCKSEYPGCFCVNGCNASCSCATNMRECDPDICKCCTFNGVKNNSNSNNKLNQKSEINKDFSLNLDQKNYLGVGIKNSHNNNNKILFFDCGNCSIFIGKRKKTCVSQSLVADNYGLFANEDIDKDDFICEYIGELLSREETDRRSVFNDQLGLNYFFKLNDENDIDAYAIGNEMRYFFFFKQNKV